MSTFFISDLHLGHKKILEYSPERGGTTVDEHDEWLIQQWNSVVKSEKRDLVWVLGDVCFDRSKLKLLSRMNGRKKLVLGNHDQYKLEEYFQYFDKIFGFTKAYKCWLSHAPVHPDHLRGCPNIHGHLHTNKVRAPLCSKGDDLRYINVSVEQLDGIPMNLEDVREVASTSPWAYRSIRGETV